MAVNKNNEIPKSLAILGTAIAGALALALVLSSAPVLGGRDSALAAGTECTGGGGNEGTPSPSPTQSSGPLPGPIQTLLSPSPKPTGSASPTGTPSASPSNEMPDPAMTTPTSSPTGAGTPTGSPTGTPVTSPPDSTTRCRTEITISHDAERQLFSGRVKSDKAACERGRRVLLKLDRDGRDRTVGTTTSNRRGRWKAAFPNPDGRRFYAKAPRQKATTARGDIVCLGDRSRSIRAQNPD